MQQPCILSAGLTWADDLAVHELELSSTWQTHHWEIAREQQQQWQPV